MTTPTTPTTELPDPPDGFPAYGVTIHCIGEDGETLVAFGHVDKSRFLAACNHFARTQCGLTNVMDDRHATWNDVEADITHTHGRFVTGPDVENNENDWEVWWGRERDNEHPTPITVWELR